jgi:serine/threonine protein kinase
MSPEQLAGDKLDGRSDVYSLALVAFNMLTGTLPFPSDTAQESMIMRLTDEPKSLTEMKPDIIWPQAVQDVMKRALQRKSGDRYQKAMDFGNALYMAVERMPKNSAADVGTVVLGAETALLSAPPPTRVDPSASAPPMTRPSATVKPSAPAPAPAKTSRTALYAGGGVAVAAVAVAAFVIFSKGGSTPPVKHDGAAPASQVAANVPANVPVNPAANPGGGTPTQSPVLQGSQPTGEPSVPTTSQKKTPNGLKATPPSNGAVDISARLPALLLESADDATAAKSLAEAERLQRNAVGSNEIIGLSVVRAQALAMLGKDPESCDILNTIKERAAKTKYEERVQRMLKSC